MVLNSLRWAVVALLFVAAGGKRLASSWPPYRAAWRRIVFLGSTLAALIGLFYLAAHHTSAVNLTIIQGFIPATVPVGALLIHGVPIRPMQLFGLAIAIVSVAIVASGGTLVALLGLKLNLGNMLTLAVCFLYAGYAVALRDNPAGSSVTCFTLLSFVALAASLPLLAIEALAGAALWPTREGLAILFFVSLFPSLLAQICFIRGVEIIGPGEQGASSIWFRSSAPYSPSPLGELSRSITPPALALVIGAIVIAERSGR